MHKFELNLRILADTFIAHLRSYQTELPPHYQAAYGNFVDYINQRFFR